MSVGTLALLVSGKGSYREAGPWSGIRDEGIDWHLGLGPFHCLNRFRPLSDTEHLPPGCAPETCSSSQLRCDPGIASAGFRPSFLTYSKAAGTVRLRIGPQRQKPGSKGEGKRKAW